MYKFELLTKKAGNAKLACSPGECDPCLCSPDVRECRPEEGGDCSPDGCDPDY